MHGFARWIPRIVALAMALFLSLFAADVFTTPGGPAEKLVALFMHLVPTWIVLATLAASWRREWIGAAVFPVLAVAHLVLAWGRLDWSAYVVIEAPLLVLGVLYLAAWRDRAAREVRSH